VDTVDDCANIYGRFSNTNVIVINEGDYMDRAEPASVDRRFIRDNFEFVMEKTKKRTPGVAYFSARATSTDEFVMFNLSVGDGDEPIGHDEFWDNSASVRRRLTPKHANRVSTTSRRLREALDQAFSFSASEDEEWNESSSSDFDSDFCRSPPAKRRRKDSSRV